MAKEASIQASLQIRKGNLVYAQPWTFTADVAGKKGPSPGAITVTPYGTDVDLSQLTNPSLCWLCNTGEAGGAAVEYGIWDPETLRFHPLGEILPGEAYPLRLSRNIFTEFGTGTGTGSVGPVTNRLRFRSLGAGNVDVRVDCFSR